MIIDVEYFCDDGWYFYRPVTDAGKQAFNSFRCISPMHRDFYSFKTNQPLVDPNFNHLNFGTICPPGQVTDDSATHDLWRQLNDELTG